MKISGQLEWTDYLKAQFLHTRSAWWQRVLWAIAIVAFLGGFISGMLPDNAAEGPGVIWAYIWLPIVIGAVLLLYYYVLLPRRVRQIFAQNKELSSPFAHEITPTGLITSNAYGQSSRPWGDFHKWKENKDLLLLYVTDIEFILIPKRFCTEEQIEALRAQMREHNVRDASIASRRSIVISIVVVFWLIVGAIIYAVTINQTP